MELPTILFTPGACHDPWAFDLVRSALSTKGFPTSAVALATVGSPDPSLGLEDDIAAVRVELQRLIDAGNEVIVVAHSYGGIPVSNAVEGLKHDGKAGSRNGGVIMIVYLTAWVIPVGSKLLDHSGDGLSAHWNIQGDYASAIDPINVFYADVNPALANKAASLLRTQNVQALSGTSNFAPWTNSFEVGYIFAENDVAIPLAVQQGMASEFPAGSFTTSLRSSHSPFLSMPESLAGTIQQAFEHVATKRGW
ncbi:Alpha/beta hydrolase fold-1 [Ilyonectria destructans]|nr:Alpha/beta hydrolase fold-1 [Ilyonectria destructans]